MKYLTVAIWLCMSGVAASQVTTATPRACSSVSCVIHGAPAPEIGAGIPALLGVAGVLLGATLLKRWRRS